MSSTQAHSHPNGTEVSDDLKNMRNEGRVDEAVESRIRSYFEVVDDGDTGYIGAKLLFEELERFGCTTPEHDFEKLFMHEVRKKRLSVDDFIIVVARNPALGDALQEARLHERAAGYVDDAKEQDAGPKSNLQPDFNVSVFDRFDAHLSVVLRELDESDRFVQKSAESTSI